jgi:hypothetical protein
MERLTRIRVDGASWVVPHGFGRHYARCARTPASPVFLRDLLALVGYDASDAYVRRLSLRERVEVEVYATREHAAASDNPVQRHPRPSHLPPPWRGQEVRRDFGIDYPSATVLRAPSELD